MKADNYVKVFSDSEFSMQAGSKTVANNIIQKISDNPDFDNSPDSKVILRTPLFDGKKSSMEKFLKGDDSGLGGMKLSSFTAKEPGQTDLHKSKGYDMQVNGLHTDRAGIIGTTKKYHLVNLPHYISTLYNPNKAFDGDKLKKHSDFEGYLAERGSGGKGGSQRTKNDSQIGSFLYWNPTIYNDEEILLDIIMLNMIVSDQGIMECMIGMILIIILINY